MTTQNKTIETGIETVENSDVRPQQVDADVIGFADDGEFAATMAVERVDDETVHAEYHVHEAGLDEVNGPVSEFNVDPDKATDEWAREAANADPELAIEGARAYYAEGDR